MDIMIHFNKIAIYGVGLLGGAIGIASKKAGLADRITGIGRNDQRLKKALTLGAIDECTTKLEAGAADCDLFIFCLPVKKIVEQLPTVARLIQPGCIVTDVGSTKRAIVEASRGLFQEGRFFVGSHPMTGSNRSGCEHAPQIAFEGVTSFVTVVPETNREAVARIALFWKALGMVPVLIDPARHDEFAALVSHLPHLTAVALANTISHCPDDLNFLKQVSGKGFRDTTRVAMGDITMWQEICHENKTNIIRCLNNMTIELEKIKEALLRDDEAAIQSLLDRAKSFREKFD